MRLEDQLARTISEHLATAPQPRPHLADAVRRGRGIRRRRRIVGLAAVAAVVVGGAIAVPRVSDVATPKPERFAPVGRLDYSKGLRAFASPDQDGKVSIGGRSFPNKDMGYLDTDATATPYGLVFFDKAMQPHLLARDGTDRPLAPAPDSKPAVAEKPAEAKPN